MGVRTVRLDAEAEKALAHIVRITGLSISGALKQGLLVLHTQRAQQISDDRGNEERNEHGASKGLSF